MSYGVFSAFYDEFMQDVPYEALQETICSLLARYGVGRGLLLDLACGTGTLSLALSEAGYDVIGVDGSEDMLMEAQQKAMEAGKTFLLLCQDMRELDLYGTIDAAVCTLDSLNHLPNAAAVQAALSRVSLFLNPNGLFIFDVNTLYKHQKVLGNNTFIYETEDVFCSWQNTLLDDNATVSMDLDFFIETEDECYARETEQITETAYSLSQWEAMLQAAGFELLEVRDGYTENAPTDKTERYLFVCRKES